MNPSFAKPVNQPAPRQRKIDYNQRNHALTSAEIGLWRRLRQQFGTHPFPTKVLTPKDKDLLFELVDQGFMLDEGEHHRCNKEVIGPAIKD